MNATRPSAPPMMSRVIYVIPSAAWRDIPSDPPPPYSLNPPDPITPVGNMFRASQFDFPRQNRNVARGACSDANPGLSPVQIHFGSIREDERRRRKKMKINKEYLSSGFAVLKAIEFVSKRTSLFCFCIVLHSLERSFKCLIETTVF